MRRALKKLSAVSGRLPEHNPHLLVDGPRVIEGVSLPQTAVVKGDRSVFTIAAASVLAKVHRDALMVRAAKRYPRYGFEAHKGYGTKAHYAALLSFGPTPLHRRSFRLT
jgi:ribonuclease HII